MNRLAALEQEVQPSSNRLAGLQAEAAGPAQDPPPATKAEDTWGHVLKGGSFKEIMPVPERPGYQGFLDTIENPDEFEAEMGATLFMSATLGSDPGVTWGARSQIAEALFQKPIKPTKMLSFARKNEAQMDRYTWGWNKLQRELREEEPPPWWEDVIIKRLAAGLANVASGTTGFVEQLEQGPMPGKWAPSLPAEAQKKLIAKHRANSKLYWEIAKHPDLVMQRDDAMSKLFGMAAETVPYITATTAASLLIGPVGGFLVGHAVEGNSAYRTALEHDVPEARARQIGAAVGLAAAAIESFGGAATDKLFAAVSEKIMDRGLRAGAKFGFGTVSEALEEAGQEIANEIGESTYRDVPWDEAVRRTMMAAGGGAALGGGFHMGRTATRLALMGEEKVGAWRAERQYEAARQQISEQLGVDIETLDSDVETLDGLNADIDAARAEAEKQAEEALKVADKQAREAPPAPGSASRALTQATGPVEVQPQPDRQPTVSEIAERATAGLPAGPLEAAAPSPAPAVQTPAEATAGQEGYAEPWQMTLDEALEAWAVPEGLPAGTTQKAGVRLDREGNDTGPGMLLPGTLGSSSIQLDMPSKPSSAVVQKLREQGYTSDKSRRVWTSPVRPKHEFAVEQAVKDGLPVPRSVLEEYAGEDWADAAIAKLTPAPGAEGKAVATEKPQEAPEAQEKNRRGELAKTTKAIKSHPLYQLAQEQAGEAAFVESGLTTFYVPESYKDEVEAYAGEKGSKFRQYITHTPGRGEDWSVAAQERGWPDDLNGFLQRLKVAVEAEGQGTRAAYDESLASQADPEMELLVRKRQLLAARESPETIKQAMNEELKRVADEYDLDPETVQYFRRELIGPEETGGYQAAVGAAAINWKSRRNAVDKAQKLSGKHGSPMYVVQDASGKYSARQERPKKGHYTVVDMSQSIMDQVVFVKQASATIEDAFDYGEHPRKTLKHLSAIKKFKAKLAAKQADTQAIKQEIYDYIRTNVGKGDQHKFFPLLRRISSKRQTKTNLKDLGTAIAETEALLRNKAKKDAVADFLETTKRIHKDYKLGRKQLGKLDIATRKKVEALLAGIDPAKLSAKKLHDIKGLAQHLNGIAEKLREGLITEAEAQDQFISIPEHRLASLNRLSKQSLRKMDTADIQQLTESLKQYVGNFELKQRLRGERRGKMLGQAKADVHQEMVQRPGFEQSTDVTNRAGRGTLSRILTTDSAHLDTLTGFLTHNDAKVTQQLFDSDLQEGSRARDRIERRALETIRARLDAIGMTLDDFTTLKQPRTVVIGGETLQIAGEHLLSIYRHSQDDYNLRALLNASGYRVGERNTKAFQSVEELYEAIDQLSEKERAYSDIYQEVNNTITAPAINKASLELEGYELATNPTYWPLRYVQPSRIAGRGSDVAIEDYGRYKPRVGGTGHLRITPYSHEMLRGLQEDATYAGMMIPIHNARTVLNDLTLQNHARDLGQKDTVEAIIQILRNVQGASSSHSVAEHLGKKILNRYAQSVLSLRISTIGTQVCSMPAALAEIDGKYAVGVTPSAHRLAMLEKHSDPLWKRWRSRHITVEMGNIAAGSAPEVLFFDKHPWAEKPLKALVASDRQTIGMIAGAVENEIQGTRTDLAVGSDAYWEAVARRTETVVRRTQPMWDMLNRSVLSADPGALKRSLLMFRSALEAQYNIVLRAHNRYAKIENPTMSDKMDRARADTSVFLSASMVAIWKRLLRWGMGAGAAALLVGLGVKEPGEADDENDKSVLTTLAIDTSQNILGLLPGGNAFGPVVRNTVEVAMGESTWGRGPYDNPIADVIEGVGTVLFVHTPELVRDIATEDWEEAQKDGLRLLDNALDTTAKLTGMPYSGPRGEVIRSLQRAAPEETNLRPHRKGE